MTTIHITTIINAPVRSVFDASRNIDTHMNSAIKTKEKAISGITSGLINKNETVTWRGKHFGLYLTHQSIISEMKTPSYFVDEMLSGHFKSFRHQHYFNESNNKTEMIDVLNYEVPCGVIGKLFDKLILKKHLTRFLISRNDYIKSTTEMNINHTIKLND